MQMRCIAIFTGICLLLCGCSKHTEIGQADSAAVTVPDAAFPVLRDEEAWERRLCAALSGAEEAACGWVPAPDVQTVLGAMPEIAERAADSDSVSGMFLREISWTHRDMQDGCVLTVRFSYDGKRDEIMQKRAELLRAAAQWKAQYTMLPEDVRVLLLHDTLIRTCTYDGSGEAVHTAYGAWICGTAVCDGYAAAFQLFSDAMGVSCMTVTGAALTDAGLWVPHAWNLVQLGGEWYHIDCTWDDSDSGAPLHTWFLCTDDEAAQTHMWDVQNYPAADSKTVSYQTVLEDMLR